MNNINLKDKLGRPLRDLRISVTDRCNFRCTYCMPSDVFGPDYEFMERSALLSFEEITRLAGLFAEAGVKKLRITGGEPLLRKDLHLLIKQLNQLEGIEDIALTTNGSLLEKQAHLLKEAGLDRITVSLDSLDDDRFGQINGQGVKVAPILAGIEAAQKVGMKVKVNMMVRKGINEEEIIDMVRFFSHKNVIVRFIEFMDVGNHNEWKLDEVVTKNEIIERLSEVFQIEPIAPRYFGEVASRFRIKTTGDEIGVISSISDAFCSSCTRARLSADGRVYTCLFANKGESLRNPMRNGETNEQLFHRIDSIWQGRSDRYSEERAEGKKKREKIEMSFIGG